MKIRSQRIGISGISKLLVATTVGTLMIFPSFLNVHNWHVAMAAGSLSSVFAIPTNNIVNTKTTYDIIFTTATTGKINEVDMSFPAGFDISRTKLIEVSGIGSGPTRYILKSLAIPESLVK